MQLNPQQQAAVRYIDSPLLVLAGAGSGKTRVITEKILYLLKRCGYDASGIYAVTFTNKAAREMKERLGEKLPPEQHEQLSISTFHTLGLNIIRQEAKALGRKSSFTIFDAYDCQDLLRNLSSKQKNVNKDFLFNAQMQISNWKNALTTPERALIESGLPTTRAIAELYGEYQKHLQAYNAVDFDDLIVLPVQLFQQNPEILSKWQGKIRYLMVDEYQDTNDCQYALVKLLMGGRNSLTVVGDDDQSIYAWRGAKPENLNTLNVDFPSLKLIKLEQNYRSTGCILQSANHLIKNNPHVYDKSLWSELGFGERIRIIACEDDSQEAEQVAAEIRSHQLRYKKPFSDYAILYRSNHQARVMEKALRTQQLPYTITGGLSFFSRSEIKDILAYCRLLVNYEDDAAFLRVVNTPRRGVGTQTLEKLGNYAGTRHCSLMQACQEIGLSQVISGASLTRLQQFATWLNKIKQQSLQQPIQALHDLLKSIDYRGWLSSQYEKPEDVDTRMSNVEEFIDWLDKMIKDGEANTLVEAVNRLLLLNSLESKDDNSNAISMMTMHASKGLEFPYVYILGMEEEILPHRNSIEEDNIEEERRLAYVGITRAKQNLTLMLAKQRKQMGKTRQCQPSRFLDELPKDNIQWHGKTEEKSPEEQQASARSHLSALRDLLQ